MRPAASPRLFTALAAACAVVALAAAGTSSAGTAPKTGCSGSTTQPFLRWIDPASYVLAPNGAFESTGDAWTLAGGARVVAGSETFGVHGRADQRALSLPAGSSATSPAFCIGLGHPTIRFFAKGGGSLGTALRVDVLYTTALGPVTQPIGLVLPSRDWSPTLPQLLVANATGLLALDGLTSSVRIRVTPLGNASWTVDDVFVDPWKIT